MQIRISEIFIPPDRQRVKVTESKIAELAISIKTFGQLHAITVAKMDFVRFPDAAPHLKYILVAGYRRSLATTVLKEPYIEANFREELDPLQQAEIELDENLQREQLSYQDECNAKLKMMNIRRELYGDSIRDVAEHVGESRGEFWEDIQLAKAMAIIPDLGKAKNKTQAKNKLRLITRRMKMQEKAEELANAVERDPSLSIFTTKVFLGDCTDVVKTWADGCLHCVITDPPYGIGLDQGEMKKGNLHPVIYEDDHYKIMDLYERIAREAYRLLRDDTHAYFFFDIKAYSEVYKALSGVGFNVEPIPLIWAKPGSGQTNDPSVRWGNSYETCFFCRKGNRALLRQGQANVLNHAPVPHSQKIHAVEKPTALLRQLIESSTVKGEVIADFFGGSGSLAQAAMELGRNFLIVEKDAGYHAQIIDRLSKLVENSINETGESDELDDDNEDQLVEAQ